MNKYRMKVLYDLDKTEEQVKQGVRMQLKKSKVKRRKQAPLFAGGIMSFVTILLLVFLIQPTENVPVGNGSSAFSVSEFFLEPLKLRESSYVAIDLKWDGLETATLESIELVNVQGVPLTYHEHHLEMRPWNVSDVEPGQYQLGELSEMEEFSRITFKPNSKRAVLLELIGNEGFKQSSELALKLMYTVNDEEIVQTVEWSALDTIVVEQLRFTEVAMGLGMKDAEMEAYDAFKASQDPKVLSDLSPISIARLYVLADIEGDDALQYAFYTDREEYVAWSYEEQLMFPVFDRLSLDEVMALFEAVSVGLFVETGDDTGYIELSMNGMAQGFQMIKNEKGIWQVAFMPMQ